MAGSTALMIIDVQNWVVETAWNADAVVARLVAAIGKARASGAPVVYIQHNVPGDPKEGMGTPGWEIDPRIAPQPGDLVIEKRWRDAFVETGLADALRERGIAKLVIGGMDSELCVRSTVLRALVEGFDVTLLEDGHTTSDREMPSGNVIPAPMIAEHQSHTIRTLRYPGREIRVTPVAAVEFAPVAAAG